MAIYKIAKKEYDKIRHDQSWGIYSTPVFERNKKYFKCSTPGAAGAKEIARYRAAIAKVERDQLNLLGLPNDV